MSSVKKTQCYDIDLRLYDSFKQEQISSSRKELINYAEHQQIVTQIKIFLSLFCSRLLDADKSILLDKSNKRVDPKYVWDIFCQLYDIFSFLNYYRFLRKRHFNWISKDINQDFPHLMKSDSPITTLKFPHISNLTSTKKKANKYFRELIKEKFPNQDLTFLTHPEFHKCHLECHLEKKIYDNESVEVHNKVFCHCYDEKGSFINHPCKLDWHVPTAHDPKVNFSSWPHEYFTQTISPFRFFYSQKLGYEIDEVTYKLCYLAKDWPERYKKPILYENHGYRFRNKFHGRFNSVEDQISREKKSTYNSQYNSVNPEKWKDYTSHSNEYQKLRKRRDKLTILISKSRGEKKKILRAEKREIVFKLSALKKNFKKTGG